MATAAEKAAAKKAAKKKALQSTGLTNLMIDGKGDTDNVTPIDTQTRTPPEPIEAPTIEPKVSDEKQLIRKPPSSFYVDPQVRTIIKEEDIVERAASMRSNGQMQPIVVHPADENGRHLIEKGECRWRASQRIDDFLLEAVIDPNAPKRNEKERIVHQLIENVQRSDLVSIEEANAIQRLIDLGMSRQDIAVQIGYVNKNGEPNVTKVGRVLSILKMPEDGQKLAEEEIVTDLITLEFFRKINDINPSKFKALVMLARQEDGLSRTRAQREFEQCKENETGATKTAPVEVEHKETSSPSKDATAQSSNATQPQKSKAYPQININWRDRQEGYLDLHAMEKAGDGTLWVKLDNGDSIQAESEDIQIESVTF